MHTYTQLYLKTDYYNTNIYSKIIYVHIKIDSHKVKYIRETADTYTQKWHIHLCIKIMIATSYTYT